MTAPWGKSFIVSLSRSRISLLYLTAASILLFRVSAAQVIIHGEGEEGVIYYTEKDLLEDRGRIQLGLTAEPADWMTLRVSGYGEYLLRSGDPDGTDTNFRFHDTYLELRGRFLDFQAGYSTIVWGVLDEIQPNDVINPLDVSRFFFEGRKSARLPIPLFRTRIYLPDELRLELVTIPFFEKSAFDQLGEAGSPFNIVADEIPAGVPIRENDPPNTFREMEFGGRLSFSTHRTDLDFYVFRGREDTPVFVISPRYPDSPEQALLGQFPRFTMLGGSAETVIGRWGIRGEGSVFLDDSFQDPDGLELISGRSVELGIGFDRELDDYLLNGNIVYQKRTADNFFLESPEDLLLIGGVEHRFRYGQKKANAFLVYNPLEGTLFLRGKTGLSPVQDFWLEISAGLVVGSGNDLVGRFEEVDNVSIRGRYYF